jgi:drug/metabolite transporter (DMT)-like permease
LSSPSHARTAAFAAAALVGFAANSILCRLALGRARIDPASFTAIRLLSGAIVLLLLIRATHGGEATRARGSWISAAALFAYAVAFSFAYLRIHAGVGALTLFATVQVTMVGWGWMRGERPRLFEWLGLAIALGGLVALALPGLSRPDPVGLVFMAGAGVAWGIYSLRGRAARDPLAQTAGNFLRSLPAAAGLVVLALPMASLTWSGALSAMASGALASGVGYSLWYAALPGLTATRAGILQLSVPALAAAGGIALLGEPLTERLAVSAAAILSGVALAMLARRR